MELQEFRKVEEKFRKKYNDWISQNHPELLEKVEVDMANVFIEYFRFLRTQPKNQIIDAIQKFNEKKTWRFSPADEILLDVKSTCVIDTQQKMVPMKKELFLLNAFLLKKNYVGFKSYDFIEDVDTDTGYTLFKSEEMEKDFDILTQNDFIKRISNSAPVFCISERGQQKLKKNIMYYILIEKYNRIVLKSMKEYYEKSLTERKQMYRSSLLF